MPVGTRASVKAVGPDDLRAVGAQIVLANTYHLALRPGAELIRSLGGVQRFMGWDGPVLTDSGGYQVYSLRDTRQMSPEGIRFASVYDGSKFFLSPEKAVEAQTALGSDIMMCLDECTPYPATEREAQISMDLTFKWAERSRASWDERGPGLLFGIAQGSFYPKLRTESAQALASLDFPGYAAGGLALGEPPAARREAIAASFLGLPELKPRYLMGLGTPLDLLEGIKMGADLFDCVMPSRNARNGQLFTARGKINIDNSRHRDDSGPVDPNCPCYCCRTFSRAYLRHLHRNREPLFPRLATIHNLSFYLSIVHGARESLLKGEFPCYYKELYEALTQR
jgi:queuine tRNA-ribosyltransferase